MFLHTARPRLCGGSGLDRNSLQRPTNMLHLHQDVLIKLFPSSFKVEQV